jgi:type 2 lantibiotic biosynthesis protein LanM
LRTIEETVELVLHPTSSLQGQARESLTVGAFDGLGSLIYLFVHLGRLWREPTYLILAEALARLLEGFIARDERLDIITGSAGGLASLLNLYQAAPGPQTLAIAVRCGEHLLARARQMPEGLGWETFEPGCAPAGFSHGAAGIALSLLRLASVTGEERFRRTALQSMAYERSLFDGERGNWPRELKRGEKDFPVFWCHGSPGIGLARLASLEHVEDQALRQDIELALETTLGQGFGRNQSLCHGDLGSLETVLVAARTLNHPACCEALPRLTALVFHGIQEHGRVTGVPLGVETPGLMTGLAGIGYELLRLANPDRVPSVLTLAPPLA